MKIAHLGAYDANVGDNIALRNVRRAIDSRVDEPIEWVSTNILDFHKKRNNVHYCEDMFRDISKSCQAIVVGGGGLVEGGHYNKFDNSWKLPFQKSVLQLIKIPIFCCGVGINYFWGQPELNPKGKDNFKRLVDKSALFSVRDDGSYEIAESFAETEQIYEVPDPGLMALNAVHHKGIELYISVGGIQPAWNRTKSINEHRFGGKQNLTKIRKLASQFSLIGIPHTMKDFHFPGIKDWLYEATPKEWQEYFRFNQVESFVEGYRYLDYVVALRGHGQIISMGMNVPGIYLATQPKVLGFSEKSDMGPYTVSIKDQSWWPDLLNMIDRIKNDNEYVVDWYQRRNTKMETATKIHDSFFDKLVGSL